MIVARILLYSDVWYHAVWYVGTKMNSVIHRNISIFLFVDVNNSKLKQNGTFQLFLTGHHSEAIKHLILWTVGRIIIRTQACAHELKGIRSRVPAFN